MNELRIIAAMPKSHQTYKNDHTINAYLLHKVSAQ